MQASDPDAIRVLGFCDHFPPSSTGGGAERVAMEIWSRLVDEGFEVLVLAANPSGREPPAGRFVEAGIEVVPVPAVDLSRATGMQLQYASGLYRRALELVHERRPRALHAHSMHFQTSVAAARVARATGLPLATTVHVAGIGELPPAARLATEAWERTVGRFILGQSDAILAVSHPVADHVRRRGARSDQVHVVPNGVCTTRFVPGPLADPPVVSFVGRLIANKGPAVLLEAARRLAGHGLDFLVELVGDGPLRADLEAAARRSPVLRERVTFTGFVPDVEHRLARASILVRPSTTEGMPLAVLEAMAAGTAVIASDIPPHRELVSPGRTGLLFPVGDVDALAASMGVLLRDPGLLASMAVAGRSVAAGMGWDASAARTANVLRGLASDAPIAVPA